MTDDPWHADRLDLDAYLARIGVAARPPSRAALDELYEAHVRTFTFDNIDVLLDQHPGVDLEAVAAKFVGRGRGGYCFEHATLLAAALVRLGYQVERRLGRVGDPPTTARTHCVVIVTVDGQPLLADPGFGFTLLRPIPLADGATDDYQGFPFQVRQITLGNGRGWELLRRRESGWEIMHTHDELPVEPIDLVCGHHYTSTFPTSHFRHGLMIARYGDGQHTTVTHTTVTIRRPGRPTEHRDLGPDELPDLLRALAVPLTTDEHDRLLRRAAELRTAG
ncbi:MAG: arylamine N-acetyltransferase [Frankia sp.]|nr:arylamine N-acetyltransferase [Frankia sp.]